MQADNQLTFFDYVRPVWRFKYAIVLLVVAAAAVTYVLTNRQTKTYEGSTTIYVGASRFQQVLTPGVAAQTDRQVSDQAGLINTLPVAKVVKSELKVPYPARDLLGS